MVPTLDEEEEVSMEIRDASPADYLLKIENFSKLLKAGNEKFKSREFESGGYKWKLILYPKGRTSGDGDGDEYLSVYLELADPGSLPAGSEINAIFSFFLHNQIYDNYLSIQGRTRRFHAAKIEWGINRLISTKALTEPSNGYIVDDNVVFGAEVHVITKKPITECLSMFNDTFSREWKISELSFVEAPWTSEEFTAGNHRWRIKVHPKGCSAGKDKSISAFLETANAECFKVHEKVKADFTIYIKDQKSDARHAKRTCFWFSSEISDWGWPHFMPLADLDGKAGCFVLDGYWVFGIEISVPSTIGANLNKISS